MNVDAILDAIYDGKLDSELNKIENKIKRRREFINAPKKHTIDEFKVGDHVRITGTARPAYLVGLTATVVKINKTRVKVEFHSGQNAGRFAGKVTNCPISILEILKPLPLATARKRKRRKLD